MLVLHTFSTVIEKLDKSAHCTACIPLGYNKFIFSDTEHMACFPMAFVLEAKFHLSSPIALSISVLTFAQRTLLPTPDR